MRQYMKKIIIYFMMVTYLFMLWPSCVYASEHGGGGGSDHNSNFITDSGTINVKDDGVVMYYIEYILANMGAIIRDHDLTKAMANDQTMKEYISKGKFDAKEKTVTFPKETVIYIKQSLDEYAKQYEPYTLYQTIPLSRISYVSLGEKKNVYDSMKNLLADSPSGIIGVTYNWINGTFRFTDIGSHFKDVGLVMYFYDGYSYRAEVKAYDIETWNHATYPRYEIVLGSEDTAIENKEDFISRATTAYTAYSEYIRFYCLVGDADMETLYRDNNCISSGNQVSNFLLSNDTRRIRVYNTYADFQDYTFGKRSVYYTKEYYSYVPEDLSVSIDDLQESVGDLQKVIDDLLGQISKGTDESEIEELLRQILDELKNQQGTGSGGGSGSGDVTVNVDMTQTNSWLAKIYAKVSEISDKIQSDGSDGSSNGIIGEIFAQMQENIVASIESLKEMLDKHLKTIISDLGDIKDQLDDMSEQEFSEKTESFLDDTMADFSEIGDKAKGKFPFSIPNDIRLLISKMSVSQPEYYGPGTYSVMTMAYDEDVGSNDLIMVMDDSVGDVPIISETGAPIFYLPFVIASAGIEEYVLIDLSGFEPISSFCRSLMTIYFILCLFNLTFKVMGLWGDLVD